MANVKMSWRAGRSVLSSLLCRLIIAARVARRARRSAARRPTSNKPAKLERVADSCRRCGVHKPPRVVALPEAKSKHDIKKCENRCSLASTLTYGGGPGWWRGAGRGIDNAIPRFPALNHHKIGARPLNDGGDVMVSGRNGRRPRSRPAAWPRINRQKINGVENEAGGIARNVAPLR